MTEFKGYRSSRRPEFLFLSSDWRPPEIYENFRQYEQDFRDIVEDVEIEEDFYIVGERNDCVGLQGLQKVVFGGEDVDVAIADVELEAEGVEGNIRYEGHLPGEGAGRIEASFEVTDPELEEDVRRYVEDNFNSFLGLDTGYNPLRP